MTQPQPGLFIEQTHIHLHQFLKLKPGVIGSAIKEAVSRARTESSWLGGPNIVWGFGPDIWRSMAADRTPSDLEGFTGISGTQGINAPATQWDIWVWCHGATQETVWLAARDIALALEPVASLEMEQNCYTSSDGRDPIGFIDGTENPQLDEALEVSLVPDGSVGAGGTSVFIQKWVHKLKSFDALTVPEQNDVFGRTRADSIELDDDVQPPTSHVSRNVILDSEGNERHIYRRNTPFASLSEVGTMFIGCTRETDRITTMLDRMFGTSGDGLFDRLIEFSQPISGGWYFAPSMTDLSEVFHEIEPLPADVVVAGGVELDPDLAKAETEAAGANQGTSGSEPNTQDPKASPGSLGIGSLLEEHQALDQE